MVFLSYNYIGRGAILPNLDGLEHLLQCPATASHSQIDFADLKADDINLGRTKNLHYNNLLVVMCNYHD